MLNKTHSDDKQKLVIKITKSFSISISDWVYETYLKNVKLNRSALIEEMIVKGSELSIGEYETSKQRIITLSNELRDKTHTIDVLNAKIGRLESIVKKRPTPEELAAKKKAEQAREWQRVKGRTMKSSMPELIP